MLNLNLCIKMQQHYAIVYMLRHVILRKSLLVLTILTFSYLTILRKSFNSRISPQIKKK